MALQPRQTRLRLLFSSNDTDVSADLAKDLLSWSYVDRECGQTDEITLQLKDETGKWAGSWNPDGGESVKMYFSAGTTTSQSMELYAGKFYVDYKRVSGAPRIFEIRAVSVPLNKDIRKLVRTKGWEKTTLKAIAEEVAKNGELELFFDSEDNNPSYTRVDQKQESDLSFLLRLCEDAGLSVKVTDSQLVIFSQENYEKKDPVTTIILGVSELLNYEFEAAQSETYKSVTVRWRDPNQKKKGKAASYDTDSSTSKTKTSNPAVMEYTYTDPNADEQGQDFVLKKRATSKEEAMLLAKAKLRQLNCNRVTGSLTLVGNPILVAGVVIAVSGFGSFDGNFIIEEATHSGGGGGYTTALRVRRVNAEY